MNDHKQKTLTKEIQIVLNKLCVDNDLSTPDFVLADYVVGCLKSYKKEIVGLNDINRGTQEGKLLFAALSELTTKLYTNREPEQVIEILQEIHRRNTFEPGGQERCCVESKFKGEAVVQNPFEAALAERINEEANRKNGLLKNLATANNVILKSAQRSLNPDDYTILETLLVNLYRHYEQS